VYLSQLAQTINIFDIKDIVKFLRLDYDSYDVENLRKSLSRDLDLFDRMGTDIRQSNRESKTPGLKSQASSKKLIDMAAIDNVSISKLFRRKRVHSNEEQVNKDEKSLLLSISTNVY
jgi:hypothetical protein